MDCALALIDGTIRCTVCGRECDRADKRRMCRAGDCRTPPPAKPTPRTCPECGEPLVRKQRLPEGKWWWRCVACRLDVEECATCNARRKS